ncbi:MAG TPA: histidine kinase [Steroidobacteraceae bacterium]|nr:histidine kinase [Steroidobacteraceae bacterium]
MNAVTPEHGEISAEQPEPPAAGATRVLASSRSARWALPGILTAFWIYVAGSNILYAIGMSASFDPTGKHHYFASWDARVLQHVLLYPALLGCLWTSLRVGWRPWWFAVPAQMLLALLFAGLANPLMWVSQVLTAPLGGGPQSSMLAEMWNDWPMWLASTVSFELTYGFALALVTGFVLYRRFREAELRSSALESAWGRARLAALRMQLSPHTLFNLLHTIRGHIAWDPAAAQAMIVRLGDLLRRLLNAGERDFSTLSQELEFAQLYLQLQQSRFADRLSVTLPEPQSAPAVWVPSLILQPLIENAVTHGLADHAGPVSVQVQVVRAGPELVLRVLNTTSLAAHAGEAGVGLHNVRERLRVHFGAAAHLSARASEPGEWVSEICLPALEDVPSWHIAAAARAKAA